ncbi:hypothetical protein [Streptomyces sp. NPDC047009]|uniref:hypothetical protein n=1 Tax=unclassified Streptomyces TaxID=2593676 RepID=UPI0033F923EE
MTWCTIIVLVGGTMPLIGIRPETGGLTGFVLMLFVGEPILITLACRARMLILLPLSLATSRRPR